MKYYGSIGAVPMDKFSRIFNQEDGKKVVSTLKEEIRGIQLNKKVRLMYYVIDTSSKNCTLFVKHGENIKIDLPIEGEKYSFSILDNFYLNSIIKESNDELEVRQLIMDSWILSKLKEDEKVMLDNPTKETYTKLKERIESEKLSMDDLTDDETLDYVIKKVLKVA